MAQIPPNTCILTFDIEEWYHGAYPGYDYSMVSGAEVRVVEMTEKILTYLERFGARATFFVLGEVAQRHPEVVRMIADAGQEVASHGFEHIRAPVMGPDGFRRDVERSCQILESLSGKRIRGFRAPNFAISPRSVPWAFEILIELGFEYDSSVFPAVAYYGGDPEASRFFYKIGNLWEFPPSAIDILGVRVPFSGGFYFRLLPWRIVEKGIKDYLNRGIPPVLYLHPKDIDLFTPKLPLGKLANFVHRGRTRAGAAKFERLLRSFKLISIGDYIDSVLKGGVN